MTKKNILKIAAASAAALAVAAVFCGAYYAGSDDSEAYNDVIGKTKYCTHSVDQEYTEPTVKPGKYYLNGDINSCYLEVTENTWQVIPVEGCDLETLYGESNKWSDEAPADPASASDATPELTESRLQCKEEIIEFYSQPHDYTVVTWHTFDNIWLCPGPGDVADDGFELAPQVYYQNGVGYPGPVLKNENTISTYSGDFIFVE